MFRFSPLFALPLTLAEPALAQERSLDAVINYWAKAATVCTKARENDALAPEEKLFVCTKVGETMDRKLVEPEYAPRSDAEANVFWSMRAAVHRMKSGIYSDIDGALTRRVCEETVRS